MIFRRPSSAQQIDILRANLLTEEKRFNDAAKLRSIERNGRVIVFRFERNGQFFDIETFATMADDPDQWTLDLLR